MTMSTPPKHNIHKFREISPRLGRDNWVSCKRELLATMRDRGFHRLITAQEPFSTTTNIRTHIVGGIEVSIAGNVPLTQLEEEWHDKNNAAYNQILLCISPELQTAIDGTDEASIAWGILVNKYKSHDVSKLSVIRTR